MQGIEAPFLVVGAGPVGMIAALLNAGAERECLVVERRSGPQTAPAAHCVNARTFEICRQAGLDMAAIFAACKDPADAGHVHFLTRLAGERIGSLPYERQGKECLEYTPTPLRNLSQHRFEPILAKMLNEHPDIDLRYGWQWEQSEQDQGGVTSIIRDLANGETLEVRSRWLVGADGAGSRVRASLGIDLVGPPRLQSFLMIHFSANLREIVRDRPGVLHFVMDPEAGGTFIAHDIDREWVYMHGFDAEKESIDDYGDERCRALVLQAIGKEVPTEILHRGSWHMSSQVAESMGRGRIFLAGDAAHRFPPTGGLGLNTGVQDAHNLAWKLRAIDEGWAPRSLLETYGVERLAVARENSEQSLKNALKMVLLAEALGTIEEPTTARMESALADPARRAAITAAVAEQAEHFDMLGLQLGYIYAKGALVPEGTPPPIMPRNFVPTAHPGARLPHAWLDTPQDSVSSLDLVPFDRFALLSFGAHADWGKAAAAAGKIPLAHVRVGLDVPAHEAWRNTCGIGPEGAVLVRPDQHIAWRSAEPLEDPAAALADVLEEVLTTDEAQSPRT